MTDKQPIIMLGYNLYFTSKKVTRVAIKHAKVFGAKLYVVSSIVGHSLDREGNVANVEAKARLDKLKANSIRKASPTRCISLSGGVTRVSTLFASLSSMMSTRW